MDTSTDYDGCSCSGNCSLQTKITQTEPMERGSVKRSASMLVLLLLFSVVLVSFPQIKAESETIVVPDDYFTIQEAVNGAGEGDVVYVRIGSYNENVYINKSLSLIGEDMSKTSIIGVWETNGTVVSVSHDAVAIRDFTIKTSSSSWMSGTGIHLLNARYCNVSNCNFVISGLGIQLPINGNGVWLYRSTEITVKDNQIDCTNIHNSYGIRLQDSPGNIIVGNTITRCNYGIVLDNSIGNNLTENQLACFE